MTGAERLEDRAVTDYTAALWQDRPVPAEEPEPAPEFVYGALTLPGSRVVAARVRGRKHRHQGANCDDWYEFAALGDITCVAVSDGAGSKKLSRVGARESCRAAVNTLTERLRAAFAERPELREHMRLPLTDGRCMDACGALAGAVQQSVLAAADAVEAAWKKRRADPAYAALLGREPRLEDFSATLLTAAFVPSGEGTCLAAACQVGDGAVALLEGQDGCTVKLLGAADAGAFSGETVFLTDPALRRLEALQSRTRIARCAAGTALVMTDGVADDYFPPERELPRLYRDLTDNRILGDMDTEDGPGPGLRLKNWLAGYVERGSFDDRTLVIVSM